MFENIGNKLSNFGGSIKQGASTFAGTMQLNANIDAAAKDLEEKYARLGEKICEEHNDIIPADCRDIVKSIEEIKEYIEKSKAEIRALSGARECPQCKKDVQKGHKFCTFCGCKMPEEEPQQGYAPAGKTFCRSCGNELAAGMAFCNMCGTKVEAAPQAAPAQQSFVNPYSASSNDYMKANEAPKAEAEMPEEHREEPVTPQEQPEMPQPGYEMPRQEPLCPKCGNQIRPGASFCNKCGNKLK